MTTLAVRGACGNQVNAVARRLADLTERADQLTEAQKERLRPVLDAAVAAIGPGE